MSSEVQPKCTNSSSAGRAPACPSAARTTYSTALTSWAMPSSSALTAAAAWGAQTQRALDNVRLSDRRLPDGFIRALALIKWAAARVNARLAGLDAAKAGAIEAAALELAGGGHRDAFPLDVFQTGSGTS